MDTPSTRCEKREATEDEVENLRHVVDSVPGVVWVALVAAGAERFTFYAVTTPWREFEAFKRNISQFLISGRKLHTKRPEQYRHPRCFGTWSSNSY